MVAPVLLIPLVPVRDVCASLNGTVAMQIEINPSLIDVVILFPSVPRRPWGWATCLSSPKALLEHIRRYCARGGFFSATVEVIVVLSYEGVPITSPEVLENLRYGGWR